MDGDTLEQPALPGVIGAEARIDRRSGQPAAQSMLIPGLPYLLRRSISRWMSSSVISTPSSVILRIWPTCGVSAM